MSVQQKRMFFDLLLALSHVLVIACLQAIQRPQMRNLLAVLQM